MNLNHKVCAHSRIEWFVYPCHSSSLPCLFLAEGFMLVFFRWCFFPFYFLKGFSSWNLDQLTLISLVTCAAQLWHFISTFLSQHLALIHPNNCWRRFWDDRFFTSERHLLWYANSNKWERGLQEYIMQLNAKINVTFQSIMTEKISDKHRAFLEKISCFLPKCMDLFVCHQGFEYDIISIIRNTNWSICHINSSSSWRIKYLNLPLLIRETSRKQTNISRTPWGMKW